MTARKRSQKSRRPGERPAGSRRSKRPQSAPDTPWIYGLHAVSAAVSNPARDCRRLLATADVAETLDFRDPALQVEITDRQEIAALLPSGAVHQGIALLASPLPAVSVEDIARKTEPQERSLIVALDQVTDPQNVGAILRSAAAFGAGALIVPNRHTPEASGAMIKAASGATEIVPVVRPTNLVRALEYLKAAGFWVVGFDTHAPGSLGENDFPGKCVLAFGAEGKGLRRLTRETCDLMVNIPMAGKMESLNVSASAAVALYEWARSQRRS